MNKKGLNRKNLDVLLSRTKPAPVSTAATVMEAPTVSSDNNKNELRQLPVDVLQRGRYQPRRDFAQESLQELADSIKTQGIIQPIVVRSVGNQKYEIIAGERRWRAAQLAGLNTVPVLLKTLTDEQALEMALIENIQREDLNPIEEAIALQRLLDEFNMTHQQVAEAVGKSRTTITNILRLLSLPLEVKNLLEKGQLEMGHARALLTLEINSQIELAKKIILENLSVRETERLVKQWQKPKAVAHNLSQLAKKKDPNIQHLQQKLTDQLGALVIFQHSSKGKGKMVIHYNNLDELDGILTKFQ